MANQQKPFTRAAAQRLNEQEDSSEMESYSPEISQAGNIPSATSQNEDAQTIGSPGFVAAGNTNITSDVTSTSAMMMVDGTRPKVTSYQFQTDPASGDRNGAYRPYGLPLHSHPHTQMAPAPCSYSWSDERDLSRPPQRTVSVDNTHPAPRMSSYENVAYSRDNNDQPWNRPGQYRPQPSHHSGVSRVASLDPGLTSQQNGPQQVAPPDRDYRVNQSNADPWGPQQVAPPDRDRRVNQPTTDQWGHPSETYFSEPLSGAPQFPNPVRSGTYSSQGGRQNYGYGYGENNDYLPKPRVKEPNVYLPVFKGKGEWRTFW